MGEQGVLLVKLPGKLPPTPYARFGLILPLALSFACLGIGLWCGTRRRTGA